MLSNYQRDVYSNLAIEKEQVIKRGTALQVDAITVAEEDNSETGVSHK